MKKSFLLLLATTALFFTSCKDNDEAPIVKPKATCSDGIQNQGETAIDCGGPNCQPCGNTPTTATCNDGIQNQDETGIDIGGACAEIITVSGEITEDTTWKASNMYLLAGKVVVGVGKTLTIEPGTIIKGKPGSGSLASALIVQRGSKIMAEGTAEKPIIFTAEEDNIAIGSTAGTNLDQNQRGKWGGLIMLGRAHASFKGDVTEIQIEGIPADDKFGLYGPGDAPNDADNSGVLKYVSIRHGGALIGEGNEINGLTLGAVGSETIIENIEIVGNVDDGVEFFGGTVNVSNILVWSQGDDAIDIDQGYSGTVSNVVVVAGEKSDHAFEIDGPEGTANAATDSFTLQNATIIGSGTAENGEYADYRSNAMGITKNIYAYGFQDGKDVELDANDVARNYINGLLTFESWEVTGADNTIFVESVPKNDNGVELEKRIIENPTFTEAAADWITTVEQNANTVGATLIDFSWTYSNAKGELGF